MTLAVTIILGLVGAWGADTSARTSTIENRVHALELEYGPVQTQLQDLQAGQQRIEEKMDRLLVPQGPRK